MPDYDEANYTKDCCIDSKNGRFGKEIDQDYVNRGFNDEFIPYFKKYAISIVFTRSLDCNALAIITECCSEKLHQRSDKSCIRVR